MIELKDYQIEAVKDLKETLEKLLRSSEDKVCIFQSPTGSGKTLMVSELLRKLVSDRSDERKFSFIWISVRMLHEQSKEKLEKYYENDRMLQCSYFEDIQDKKIGENEILFINWHSINKQDINIYVRENEEDNNLNAIIRNTKDEGREIILIIDESHHTASSEKSRELISAIAPKITLEVSATPHLKENLGGWITVNLSDVKAEEMIKSEISVNPEFLEISVAKTSSDELVIGQALKKREELARLYHAEGSRVNPLVLIQLPDQKNNLLNKKDDVLKILKDTFKITEETGKLAVWLTEEKTDTLINIEKDDNAVQVLVFKQAPALGWDCPRASILVIFRESTSFTFTIQTIGRIMRMPELRYYRNPEPNNGFIFTNLPNIEIAEDYAKDYVTVYESRRIKSYEDIHLPSIYLRRQRQKNRLTGDFPKIFLSTANEMSLKAKITSRPSKVVSPIIADGRIVNVDKSGQIERKGEIQVQLNQIELQQRFDRFIAQNCPPYAPSDSSDRMKTAIYQFFAQSFRLQKFDSKVQSIVLGQENVQFFVDTINKAKETYKRQVVETADKRELVQVPDWEVPSLISYNSRFSLQEKELSVMKPHYTKKPSQPESSFIEFLESSKSKITWWFKNGESEIKYFAILYKDVDGSERSFYVDFVIQFRNGPIGLFDTKNGITAKDAKPKAEALSRYIAHQNASGKQVRGGILIQLDGSWRYNDSPTYKYDGKDFQDWKFLQF